MRFGGGFGGEVRGAVAGTLLSLEALVNVVAKAKREGQRVVFTNGCFDLLHVGHLHLLREARSLGDVLVVGLNSDRSLRQLKGAGRPIVKEGDRATLLGALEPVDYVVIFDEPDPGHVIRRLLPDVLVKGDRYGEHEIVGSDVVKNAGGEVVRVRELRGYSTTHLLQRLRQ